MILKVGERFGKSSQVNLRFDLQLNFTSKASVSTSLVGQAVIHFDGCAELAHHPSQVGQTDAKRSRSR